MDKKTKAFWGTPPEQLSGVKLQNMRNIHLDDRVPASDVNLHRTTLKSRLKLLDRALLICSFNGKL